MKGMQFSKKMFSRILSLVMGMIFIMPGLFAQEAGSYLITRDGERIEGTFTRKVSQQNLGGVWFRQGAGAEERVPLEEIREIYVNASEQYYIYELVGQERTEPLTLRKVIEGEASLYQGNSSLKKAPVFLFRDRGNREFLIERGNLEGVIRVLDQDCPGLSNGNYDFREKDLVNLMLAYNACLGSEGEVLRVQSPGTFRLGLRAYAFLGNLKLPDGHHYAEGEYEDPPGVSAALSLAWVVNPRVRVMTEVGYFHHVHKSDNVNVPPTDLPTTYSRIKFDFHYLEVPLMVQYGFPQGKWRPFLEGGLYAGIPLSREVEEEFFVTDFREYQNQPKNSFDDINWGYTIGGGMGLELSERIELDLLARWSQASMLMRTNFSPGSDFANQLANIRTDKISLGARLSWRL